MLAAGTAEAQRPRRDWHRPRLGLLPWSARSSPTSALGSPSPTNRLCAHPRPGAASKSGRTLHRAGSGGERPSRSVLPLRPRGPRKRRPRAPSTEAPGAPSRVPVTGGAGSFLRCCREVSIVCTCERDTAINTPSRRQHGSSSTTSRRCGAPTAGGRQTHLASLLLAAFPREAHAGRDVQSRDRQG